MRTLGQTALRLKEIYNDYPTRKEAALALGVSQTRIFILCRKLGITKWDMNPRKYSTAAKHDIYICKQCNLPFPVSKYLKSPHVFCTKKCQGKYVGTHYGFGSKK